MQDLKDKKVLLGITGGIAAYKSALLVRALTEAGAAVRVVMTASAADFIGPMTLQALSGHEVRSELNDPQAEQGMGHIELARWADYFIIAPATANMIAKMAHGLADDLLSTLYLAADIPVIVAPAMNKNMWLHPAVQANVESLKAHGVLIVGPDAGPQACGEVGFGRLTDVSHIVNACRLFEAKDKLVGFDVLITGGPSRESIDPVRYISNHSSGKTAYALAQAAQIAGAKVTLVSGPVDLLPPPGVDCIAVETAADMYEAVMAHLKEGTIFIGAAAVADYHCSTQSAEKIKKIPGEHLTLSLAQNPDILASVAATEKAGFVVGFAAETQDLLANARKKLQDKKLDMIVANQVGQGLGFDVDDNQFTVIDHSEQKILAKAHKAALAAELITMIANAIDNRKEGST